MHSGDSACAIPPQTLTPRSSPRIETHTRALADALDVRGLLNVQYAVKDGERLRDRGQPARQPHGAVREQGHRRAAGQGRGPGHGRRDARRAARRGPAAPARRRRPHRGEGGGAPVQPLPRRRHRARPRDALAPARSWASTARSAWRSPRARPRRATACRQQGTVFLSLADRDKPGGLVAARAVRRARLLAGGHGRDRRRARGRGPQGRRGGRRSSGEASRRRRRRSTLDARRARSTWWSTRPGAGARGPTAPTSAAPPPPAASPASPPWPRPSPPSAGIVEWESTEADRPLPAGVPPRRPAPARGVSRLRSPRRRSAAVDRRRSTLGSRSRSRTRSSPRRARSATATRSRSWASRPASARSPRSRWRPDPWPGKPAPRLHHDRGGMLNAVGLQGPASTAWLDARPPRARARSARASSRRCGVARRRLRGAPRRCSPRGADLVAIEVNVSCPNLHDRVEHLRPRPEPRRRDGRRRGRARDGAPGLRQALAECDRSHRRSPAPRSTPAPPGSPW